ncbi:hypothetical protein [Streptomyces sp. NBRC 110611]|uniref:hypothetical protein n=1 Tax=Streptomyces sp. NBRC 110611 TaxID=1621259 RepID=UPI001C681EDF|nr:hypothetical protein [Streptomyces sp. NBRC 110611]
MDPETPTVAGQGLAHVEASGRGSGCGVGGGAFPVGGGPQGSGRPSGGGLCRLPCLCGLAWRGWLGRQQPWPSVAAWAASFAWMRLMTLPMASASLPPVAGGLVGEAVEHQGVYGGSEVAAVAGAAAQVCVFGAGLLQHPACLVQGGAAQLGWGVPASVGGVCGFVEEGSPGGGVVVLVAGLVGADG